MFRKQWFSLLNGWESYRTWCQLTKCLISGSHTQLFSRSKKKIKGNPSTTVFLPPWFSIILFFTILYVLTTWNYTTCIDFSINLALVQWFTKKKIKPPISATSQAWALVNRAIRQYHWWVGCETVLNVKMFMTSKSKKGLSWLWDVSTEAEKCAQKNRCLKQSNF